MDCRAVPEHSAEAAQDCNNREELLASRRGLMDVLQEVIHDLDADKVTQGEFDHFSFTWQAVDAVVRDQLQMLQPESTGGEPA